jgi:hypothetical protein
MQLLIVRAAIENVSENEIDSIRGLGGVGCNISVCFPARNAREQGFARKGNVGFLVQRAQMRVRPEQQGNKTHFHYKPQEETQWGGVVNERRRCVPAGRGRCALLRACLEPILQATFTFLPVRTSTVVNIAAEVEPSQQRQHVGFPLRTIGQAQGDVFLQPPRPH